MKEFWRIETDERFTYGQRIELGKLFADENASDVAKFKGAFRIVYDYEVRAVEFKTLMPIFEQIANGLKYWLDAENAMLASEPSADEIAAGCREYAEKVGELGQIVSIAKDFSILPNDLLKRPYSEVFGIMVADHERAKFEKRLNEQLTKKWRK